LQKFGEVDQSFALFLTKSLCGSGVSDMSAAEGNPKPRMISLRKVNEDLEMTEARAKRKREDDEAVGEDSELAAPREKKPVHENVPLDAGDVKPEFDFSSVSVGRNIVGCRSVDHYHNAGRIGSCLSHALLRHNV
jgi:hypothetical protein